MSVNPTVRSDTPEPSFVGTVAIASRIFAPEPAAASFRLAALANALARSGARMIVITSTFTPDVGGANEVVDDDVTVRRFPVLRNKDGYVRGYLQYLSFDVPLAARLLFARGIKAVVVEPPPTTAAVVRVVCAIRRIPYFYYAADIWSDASTTVANNGVVKVVRAVELWALRGASGVLSVSQTVTQRLAELGVSERVREVGNGVNTDLFAEHGMHYPYGSPYFLYAGTASEVHGATIFVDALALVREIHPKARIIFVGQGADRSELERRGKELGEGAVEFLPRVPPARVAEMLRSAVASLASVKPGVGYDLAFPTKLYASVACGTPAVFAGAGPGAKFVADLHAGWVADYSPDHVAEAMIAALSGDRDSVERRALAERAAQVVSITAIANAGAQFIMDTTFVSGANVRDEPPARNEKR
ncbi:glycosyltransferase involved in cell wall biosynthesis [Rhodoglobus vestalii]|uniref:D-inositol 3-phosphate glycosyltransferase n=1 Tax=Rhodoglobus vestalii TaxID=193384 RepID=A0A8H2K8T0_9MICO|nr:glycosyltransferase family 4 protein [Rhodoglobus vestalii]TQO20764.1 glycosyltransferase involved in cell wall biosynthesis [Rhodoglobus vestalii]